MVSDDMQGDSETQYADSSDEPKFRGARQTPAISAVTARRKELLRTQEWIVDKIFPAGAMHLIGGPSGVGKTTWLMQLLYDWEQGKKIFGKYQSNPCPWVMVNSDRGMRETTQTLERLGLGDWEFETYALEDLIYDQKTSKCKSPDFTLDILNKFPHAKLIVVEGIQAVMPDMSKTRSQNKNELIWALEQRRILTDGNRTVIATTHNPKVTNNGAPSNDERSKFLGSQGFIGSCSTMIGFEKGSNPLVDSRLVTVMGRNFKDFKANYSVGKENGEFILESFGDEIVQTDDDKDLALTLWALAQKEPFSVQDARAEVMRNALDMSESTIQRWLRKQAEAPDGRLEKLKDGKRMLYRPHHS